MPRFMLFTVLFSILKDIPRENDILHRIRLDQSFRMIQKSSKSTDGKLFKISLTGIKSLIESKRSSSFFGKLVFWSQLFRSLACNDQCHAVTYIFSPHSRAMVSGCAATMRSSSGKKISTLSSTPLIDCTKCKAQFITAIVFKIMVSAFQFKVWIWNQQLLLKPAMLRDFSEQRFSPNLSCQQVNVF